MRRQIALLLTLCIIFGSIPTAYSAADVNKTAGETLRDLGLVSGYANGSLGEGDQLTRAQMMVLIAQLKGENEMAKNYALPSNSIDVDPYAWYAPYVAYAEAHKWTAGIGKNRFGPDQFLTSREAATFMLKILGYEVKSYDSVMDQAYALGILKNSSITANEKIIRKDVFSYMLNTLSTPVANTSINLGVSLGVVKPEKPEDKAPKYIVKAVSPLSNSVLEVKLDSQVSVADAKQFVVRDNMGGIIEIQKADLINPTTLWLTTAYQKPGVIYTVIADKEFKYTAMSKDTQIPMLVQENSRVLDFTTIKVIFDKELDPRSALDIANYKMEGGITLLSAKFDKDKDGKDIRTDVILTTSSQERNKLYTLKVLKQVTDVSGNSVSSDNERNIFRFTGLIADTNAPRLNSVYSINAQKIIVVFDDQSDLDIQSAENIGNYIVVNRSNVNQGLNVISAKVTKNTEGKYLFVELKTTQQNVGNRYELSVSNVTDKFGNAVSSTSNYKAEFTGQVADTTGPKLLYLQNVSNTRVTLFFDEDVSRDTAEVTSNYTFDNDLSIIKAERDPDDFKQVHLTTSSQQSSRLYKIRAVGVTDEYGNVNGSSSSNTAHFYGMAEDFSKPRIVSATASVEDGKTYVTVRYTKNMGDVAKVGTNYYFGTDIGYGLSVTKISDAEYKVRTNGQSEGISYTLETKNITDISGNYLDESYAKYSFFGKSVSDTEPPKIAYVVTSDQKTIFVAFNRPMQTKSFNSVVVSDGIPNDSNIADPDNYIVTLAGSQTPLNLGTVMGIANQDKLGVTLRIGTNAFETGKSYVVYANSVESSDTIDGNTTGLYAENGIPLYTSNASQSFRGSSFEAAKPRISNVYATSRDTIEVRFNTGITVNNLTDTSIVVSGNGQTLNIIANNTNVSSTDNTVLKVRLSGSMSSSSTRYTLTINDLSSIKDMYKDLSLDSTSGGNVATLYSNSIQNDGPSISSVTSNDSTSITVFFTKEIDAADAGDYRITTDGNDITPNYAEFVANKRDQVRVYFNSANMSLGKVYKIKIPTNSVADIYGKTNAYAEESYFGMSSIGRTNVTISDFGVVGQSTVRVMFSKSIGRVNGKISASDFVIQNVTSGSAWTIDKAYASGSIVYPDSLGALANGQYVDMVDLKCTNRILGKDTSYTISFAKPTDFIAKDGALIDGNPSKSAYGQLNLDTLKLTSGVSSTALGGGSLKITITDSALSSYAIKTTFTKVGVIAKPSSPVAFDTQTKLVSQINDYNKASLISKNSNGITDLLLNGLTAENHDLLVVFYNPKNEIVGYYLVTNVAVN